MRRVPGGRGRRLLQFPPDRALRESPAAGWLWPSPRNRPKRRGVRLFIQFALFVLGAFVILRLSGFNVVAALCGFLVCPAAVMLEILYELFTYGHS